MGLSGDELGNVGVPNTFANCALREPGSVVFKKGLLLVRVSEGRPDFRDAISFCMSGSISSMAGPSFVLLCLGTRMIRLPSLTLDVS